MREMCEVVPIPLEARQLRRFRILAQAFFLDLGVVSLAQPAQPPAPALGIAPDDGRFDDQSFPLPGCAETAFDDR